MRLVDDWFYQSNARRDATDFLKQNSKSGAVYNLGSMQKTVAEIAQSTCNQLAGKYDFTSDFKFKIGFPWDRLFEISVTPKDKD